MDVQKKAEELAQAIMNSPEYKRLLEARSKVNQHQAAQIMLRDFQQRQLALHRKQMEGGEVTPEEEEQLQNLFGVISVNPYIRELFEAELAFSGLMMQVNDALTKVLDFQDEEENSEGPKLEIPKKRILIPGQDG
ncbi:MAG TPA: YlbF family regulator [Limnochordia bacterium]|nr:YlbF family regulator [Limnochordia bacterium]